jgi:hypothetical protein
MSPARRCRSRPTGTTQKVVGQRRARGESTRQQCITAHSTTHLSSQPSPPHDRILSSPHLGDLAYERDDEAAHGGDVLLVVNGASFESELYMVF